MHYSGNPLFPIGQAYGGAPTTFLISLKALRLPVSVTTRKKKKKKKEISPPQPRFRTPASEILKSTTQRTSETRWPRHASTVLVDSIHLPSPTDRETTIKNRSLPSQIYTPISQIPLQRSDQRPRTNKNTRSRTGQEPRNLSSLDSIGPPLGDPSPQLAVASDREARASIKLRPPWIGAIEADLMLSLSLSRLWGSGETKEGRRGN